MAAVGLVVEEDQRERIDEDGDAASVARGRLIGRCHKLSHPLRIGADHHPLLTRDREVEDIAVLTLEPVEEGVGIAGKVDEVRHRREPVAQVLSDGAEHRCVVARTRPVVTRPHSRRPAPQAQEQEPGQPWRRMAAVHAAPRRSGGARLDEAPPSRAATSLAPAPAWHHLRPPTSVRRGTKTSGPSAPSPPPEDRRTSTTSDLGRATDRLRSNTEDR